MKKSSDHFIRRFFTGRYSRNDYISFRNLLFSNTPDLEKKMGDHWNDFKSIQLQEERDLSHLSKLLHKKIQKQDKPSYNRYLRVYAQVAAVLLIPLLLSIGLLYNHFSYLLNQEAVFVEVTSPSGSRTHLNLPDGSDVWLNGDSYIRYPAVFKNNRRVKIIGEAFFEVTSDKQNPFLVEAKGTFVKATGTEFNVYAYENDTEVRVILKEGRVSVLDLNQSTLKDMEEGFQFILNKEKREAKYGAVNADDYSGWIEGRLVFKNSTFHEVVTRLEKWYGVDIEVYDEEMLDLHFKATFTDENLEEALKLLQSTATFNYQFIKNKKIDTDDSFERTKIIITK